MSDMSLVRVLVVDDSTHWQAFVTALLKGKGVQVIDIASSGREAVRKAQELQPSLILMDISLPDLNGIEATRHICTLAPASRILFVSGEADPDVVQAAYAAGGRGYVLKSCAPSELLKAMHRALQDAAP